MAGDITLNPASTARRKVVWPSGSSEITVQQGKWRLVGIRTPAAFDGVSFAFSENADGQDELGWLPIKDSGPGTPQEPLVSIATSSSLRITDLLLAPYDPLKIRSVDAAGVSVAQTADRAVTLIFRPAA